MPASLIAYAKIVATAHHPMDVINELDRVVAGHFDLHVYGAWHIPINDARPDAYLPGRNVFMHSSVPKAFLNEFLVLYARYGTSPVGREARLNYGPLTWTEFARRVKPTGHERWFLDLTQKYGMRDGMHCAQGNIIIGFHSKKVLKLNDTARAILNGASQLAAAHLRRLMARKLLRNTAAKLTARELAALRWYSLGEEPTEIAQRMEIGVGSVNTFLDRARKKLKAKSRPHAVRIAIYSRLLGGSSLLPLFEDLMRLGG